MTSICGRPSNSLQAFRRRYPPLAEADVDELVFNSRVPVIVYITGTCCHLTASARREFLPVAQAIQDQVAIYEVDGLNEKALVSRLNIKAMPSLLLYISGIEVSALLGFYGRDELQKMLWRIISNS